MFLSKKKLNELGIELPNLSLLESNRGRYWCVTVYWYCEMFLSDRSLITIEYIDSNDTIFEGTVQELKDTLDADLRLMCNTAPVKKAIPALCLRKGTPLSTCLMI